MLQRQLGHLMINRIVESEYADFDPLAFFPETTPEDWAPHKGWLQPRAMDPVSGNLIFPMQSFWCAPAPIPSSWTRAWATTRNASARAGI